MSLLFGRKRNIPIPKPSSTSTDAIGSDRLRKAIERNREKQMKRDAMAPSRPTSDFQRPNENPYPREPDRFGQQDYQRPSAARPPSSPRPQGTSPSSYGRPQGSTPSSYQRPSPSSSSSFGRPTSAARPTSSPRPTTPASRPLPSPNYSGSSLNTPKNPSKLAKYFLRGLWIFSIFLLVRLVFTERGVVEYYGRQGTLNDKFEKLGSIKKANQDLENEIKKIKGDSGYQKFLVRNHLGFIAHDEFIVLLPD